MQLLRTSLSCLALAAGLAAMAVTASDGPAAARMRMHGCGGPMATVCGIRADGPKTYGNACQARADGARVMHPGECQPVLCWHPSSSFLSSHPMCGRDPLNHQMMTYPGTCAIEHAGATWLYDGPCRGRRA